MMGVCHPILVIQIHAMEEDRASSRTDDIKNFYDVCKRIAGMNLLDISEDVFPKIDRNIIQGIINAIPENPTKNRDVVKEKPDAASDPTSNHILLYYEHLVPRYAF